jgi:hypothetical protein
MLGDKMNKPKLDKFDLEAEKEANAMKKAFKPKTKDFGHRLKSYYYCDGYKFNTGERHRAIGRNY